MNINDAKVIIEKVDVIAANSKGDNKINNAIDELKKHICNIMNIANADEIL